MSASLPAPRVLLALASFGLALVATRAHAQNDDDAPHAADAPPSDLVLPRLQDEGLSPRPVGAGGRVRLALDIDEGGAVRGITLLEATDEAVAASAIRHASTLRFVPGRREGRAVRATLEHVVVVGAAGSPEPEGPEPEPVIEPEAAPFARGFGASATIRRGVEPRPLAATSEQTVELSAFRDVPRFHASEMLTLTPGAVLGSHGGEGKAPNLYLRGFDAGEGQDLEILVEGVPLNEPSNAHGHGYADVQFLIPELVRSLRVAPGIFDPSQGDFALAGTAEYRLGADRRGLQLVTGVGSFRRRRALLMWSSGRDGREGQAVQEGRDDDFVAFEVQTGRGFGVNRAHRMFRSMARVAGGDERLAWSILAASHALSFDSAGVLPVAALGELPCGASADAQFFCTADPSQGGSAARHLVVGSLDWRVPGQRLVSRVWAQLRRSRFRENFTYRLLDPRGDGLDEQSETLSFGLRSDYVAERSWRGRPQQLELGLLARHDRGESRMWRLRYGTVVPYDTVFDSELALTQAGAYAGGVFRVPRVTLRAGARIAAFAFSTIDRAAPESDRMGPRLDRQAADAFGVAVLPRATLNVALWEAEASTLDWTTSVGLGTRSTDAQALSDGERAPFATARALESGLRVTFASWDPPGDEDPDGGFEGFSFDGRLGTFWTHVDRDLLFDPVAGRNVPIGASNRFGGYLQTRLSLEGWLELLGSVTWSEAHQPADDAPALSLANGPRLPFVPRFVARFDVAFRREVQLRRQRLLLGAALGASVVGRRPLPMGELSERLGVVDASVRVGWRFLEISVLARNLFDARYRQLELQYVSRLDADDPLGSLRPARHFAAGAPREIMFVASVAFDPSGASATAPRGERSRDDAVEHAAERMSERASQRSRAEADARAASARDARASRGSPADVDARAGSARGEADIGADERGAADAGAGATRAVDAGATRAADAGMETAGRDGQEPQPARLPGEDERGVEP
ncbi:MAG: TonB-dependent receptor [Myxococcales bacterium]|nr:TonB-dependent receptor [Myxococcales bacterium]